MTLKTNASLAAPQKIESLAGGPRVLLFPSAVNDIIATTVFSPLPGAIEAEREAGLVSYMHRMLLRGTTSRTNAELSEAIDALGLTLVSEAFADYSAAHVISPSDSFDDAVGLLSEVLLYPSFEPEEIERERQSTLAAIRQEEDEKLAFTMARFAHELYPGHGYGHPELGWKETVGEFTREQLVSIHAEFAHPADFLIIVVGNFEPDAARALLRERFTAASGEPTSFDTPVPSSPTGKTVRLTRESEQATLCLGFPACRIGADDWPATRIVNAVLGEGMSSRLFLRLRDEQGLAYSTGSTFGAMRKAGHLLGFIGTKPESLDHARDEMLVEFQKMKKETVPAEELERAKNYVIGKFLIDHQTNYKRSFYRGRFEMLGLGHEMDERFPELIARVTADDVLAAANRYITDTPTIVELMPS